MCLTNKLALPDFGTRHYSQRFVKDYVNDSDQRQHLAAQDSAQVRRLPHTGERAVATET